MSMANNRMALVCKDCNVGVAIAKFYPSGGFFAGDGAGWYAPNNRADHINEFFERHQHEHDKTSFGGNQYRLGYEIDDDSWSYSKKIYGTCIFCTESAEGTLQGQPLCGRHFSLDPQRIKEVTEYNMKNKQLLA